jgi:hypothetical protein
MVFAGSGNRSGFPWLLRAPARPVRLVAVSIVVRAAAPAEVPAEARLTPAGV